MLRQDSHMRLRLIFKCAHISNIIGTVERNLFWWKYRSYNLVYISKTVNFNVSVALPLRMNSCNFFKHVLLRWRELRYSTICWKVLLLKNKKNALLNSAKLPNHLMQQSYANCSLLNQFSFKTHLKQSFGATILKIQNFALKKASFIFLK